MAGCQTLPQVFLINEDIVEIWLSFGVLSTQDSKVEDLFCGAPSDCERNLFFSNYLFLLLESSGLLKLRNYSMSSFAFISANFRFTDEA